MTGINGLKDYQVLIVACSLYIIEGFDVNSKMHFAENVLRFYRSLRITEPLPEGIAVMNPYRSDAAFQVCKLFYEKFYNDDGKRFLILGINPGRYGAGLTGIPFTDPIKLETALGIKNGFVKKPELSADFIYTMIRSYGGPEKFFGKFFINSVSPLGYMQNGKNLNYYDTASLRQAVTPFIHRSMKRLLELNIDRTVAFCLGEGANHKYLLRLNEEMRFFQRIIPLAHPRFIMQYKRRQLSSYLEEYLNKLNGFP